MERPLTAGEWRALSAGLVTALRDRGVVPRLMDGAHPAARIAACWRGSVPVLTRGDRIWWPGAPPDLSATGLERCMAVLQHELQHVLDYQAGWLTAARYLTQPRHWTYAWEPGGGATWDQLGAEQRGALAERLWLCERGLCEPGSLSALRRIIAWA